MDLVERSADLKRELMEFSQHPRYGRAFRDVMRTRFPDLLVTDEAHAVMTIDYFLLQHRLRNGKTVVEQFVASRPDLSEAERKFLLGWQDVAEGVFEVEGHDGDALVLVNLIDELTYRVHSNMGPKALRPLRRGSFVILRLVPIGADWLVSGHISCFSKKKRRNILRVATGIAMQHPELAFRNPDKLEQAWERQRDEHDRFVAFFGADFVVVAGEDLTDRMRQYYAFCRADIEAKLAEKGEKSSTAPTFRAPVFSPELVRSEAVAVTYDEVEALGLYADFGPIEKAFADPALLRHPDYRRRVRDYLDDESVSPVLFRRLAARDPERASEVVRKLLGRKDFDWDRGGEKLMRQRKPSYFERPPLPRTVPLGHRLAPYAASDCA